MHEITSVSDVLPERESFDEIVALANSGDSEATDELQRLLDQHPAIWQQVGDLAQHAVLTLVNMLAGKNELLQQSIIKSVEKLTTDLAESEVPTVLEQLLISRIVCNWLECQLAITLSSNVEDETLVRSRFHLKLRESSQRRFQQAVLALQQFRKREVDLARSKVKAIQDARKAKVDYDELLQRDYATVSNGAT
ncbi:MAG: hypothetical protein FI699_09240 [SAR202 cluster bacterium]|nr:hypothetical protein [SAR202 cluster bacterium]|tara:strand:- start:3285 stop:3866 length:582 start_codon:yes stop_codon:yes gene_type:complete